MQLIRSLKRVSINAIFWRRQMLSMFLFHKRVHFLLKVYLCASLGKGFHWLHALEYAASFP